MPASQPHEARSAFTTRAPAFTLHEIEALVAERYGIGARASMLASERDLTVRIEADGGRTFVLKIANAAEDPSVSEFQNRALEHIERRAPGVPASRLVRTLAGEAEFFALRAGERHFTRLLTWLPGRPLAGTPSSRGQVRAVGAALARLARGLADFSHPAADHEIAWDLRQAGRLVERVPHIADPAVRDRVAGVFARFEETIAPHEPALRRQVVHNDFNPFNLLVDEADTDRLTGILDFGDLVETPLIYDLAVACAYQVPESGHPYEPMAELASAYHAVSPVPADELDLLVDLVAVRQAMSVTIGEWRASRYPENAAYLLRNNARVKAAMTRCAEVPAEAARALLRRACGL